MPVAPTSLILLRHPLAEALLRFDGLPSLLLHPSRLAALFPAATQALLGAAAPESVAWRRWHRHGSATLARYLVLPPVAGLGDAGLPLALWPAAAWEPLQLLAGATLAGPRLRRVITREQVETVRTQLGAAFDAVRTPEAAALHPGWPAAQRLAPERAGTECAYWGGLLLARAFDAAAPAVAARGRLRLPQDAVDGAAQALEGLPPVQALQLSYSLIERIDPVWLSSFPAAR